jgi:hypothetical protein
MSSDGSIEVATRNSSIKEDLRMDSICQRIIGLPNIGIRTFPGNRLEDILACRTARLPNPMN